MAPLDIHQADVDELLDVVGQQRLLDLKQRDQLALTDILGAATQHVDDLYPQRLGQRLGDARDPLGLT